MPWLGSFAEDDPNDLFLVRRFLAQAGVKNPIVTFADGEEAIAFLRGTCAAGPREKALRPCVLFLDIKMPKLDGFDVLRWIRKQPALKELPVVVLSGSDEPSDIKRAKELGAMRFLTKYPAAAVFAEVIAKAMRDC